MRRLIPWSLALVLLLLLVWAFRPQPVRVETAQVGLQDFAVSVEEEGVARIRDIYTVSATLSGRLSRIGLHPGDVVEAGKTVVASIGPAAPALLDARARAVAVAAVAAAGAAVDLARAQLDQAQATAELRHAEADRAAKLFDRAAVSRSVLDNAVLDARTAQAAVASAEATLAVRARELDSARAVLDVSDAGSPASCCVALIAPVSGQVLRVLTTSEQVVPAGAALLEIGDPVDLEIVTELLSRDAVRVQPGAKAEILGWGGAPLAARVRRVNPSAETKVSALGIEEQRVEVLLDLDGDAQGWRQLGHGFRVIARIGLWQGRDVLAVPEGALFRSGRDWAVFALRDGRAALQVVRLGERNGDLAQVLDGLQEGERVVLNPGDAVADGVRLQED